MLIENDIMLYDFYQSLIKWYKQIDDVQLWYGLGLVTIEPLLACTGIVGSKSRHTYRIYSNIPVYNHL